MQLYQHDSSSTFRFVLRGSLEGSWVQELEHAWITAASVLRGKELVLDVSGLTGTDENGLNLLSRMRESGARLMADTPPEAPGRCRWLGIPAALNFGFGQTKR
jgi:hypothetical protein